MIENKVKLSSIIENLIPEYVREEFPLVIEFLSQYYKSLEYPSGVVDILNNIDKYVQIDSITNLVDSTVTTFESTSYDTEIYIDSTFGFPKQYGLIQIDSEIITYESLVESSSLTDISVIVPTNSDLIYPIDVIGSLTEFLGKVITIKDNNGTVVNTLKIINVENGLALRLSDIVLSSNEDVEYNYICDIKGSKFVGCKRGFSGVTSYNSINTIDKLTFTETEADTHISGSIVKNLSILFLKEFFVKLKYQIAPGFEDTDFYKDLNESTFVKNLKEFYSSKGTDCSFELLFRGLFGQDVEVIKPRDYLISASNAQYNIFRDLVVESVSGDPLKLQNTTLYQDESEIIPQARGIVSKVEKIQRSDKSYYVVSLDYSKENNYDSVLGSFSIHPKSKTTTVLDINSTFIDVDSTLGFPESGELLIEYQNGTTDIVTYTLKTSTQFLNCKGISQQVSLGTEIKINTFAYGFSGSETIQVRITGTLSNLNIDNNSILNKIGDEINIKTLGKNASGIKENNWFFNIPVEYDIRSIRLLDDAEYEKDYEVVFYDNHILHIGDPITIISSSGQKQEGLVISFLNEKSVSIRIKKLLDITFKYSLQKNVSKVSSVNYPELNQYSANVQNVYLDKNNKVYVNSQSLPNYLYQPLSIKDRSVVFSGSFDNSENITISLHGFYTGDSVVYKPGEGNNKLDISKGVYFVKKVDNNTIKLARSRNNIYTNNFIKLNGSVQENRLELFKFNHTDLTLKTLRPQNILREVSTSEAISENIESQKTLPGTTGIFINGVELLNYKSSDQIFYGGIKNIIPKAQGNGYDIINPPSLQISDPIGYNATAYCSVKGSLERIDIIDPGFDYIETPKIIIKGGNGNEASAYVELVSFDYSKSFNSSQINTVTNTIGFSTYHKFRNNEKVSYNPQGQSIISGLSTDSEYYVGIVNEVQLKLYKSFSDSVSGINTIPLVSIGKGNHILKSTQKKKKIGSIKVTNAGKNYQNKKTSCLPIGISTFNNSVYIKDHGYSSGEIIEYNATQIPVSGLSSATSYYVTKIDENNFKLSQINSNDSVDFYYKTKQYINLNSVGLGRHIFDYPQITVTVTGRIGISTVYAGSQNFNAIVQPVFSGEIDSVFVENEGFNYGSEDILNYNKQPQITLLNGSDAEVSPVISNGKIVDIIIKNPGQNYISIPKIDIIGNGFGAILTPIVENGKLIEVKVISSGGGYTNNTIINIVPAGYGAKFESQIQSWRINLVERFIRNNQITQDDGIIYEGISKNTELEYTHLYSPRKLRSSVVGTRSINGRIVYTSDLELIDGKESQSTSHSPIIGWAYDGNPIYGPYGYSSTTGGAIQPMISGYQIVSKLNRPNVNLYPLGSFVEDYEFSKGGDLDEHNGRYCITPEFPNGIYAYFCTINSQLVESSGPFTNYKKPIFPYVIGDTYKYVPNQFNFSRESTFNPNKEKWLRNTNPYGLLNKKTKYNFIENPNKIKNQISKVKNVAIGEVESIGIVTGGFDYKVNDRVIFDNSQSGGFGCKSIVSSIKGKKVSNISVATSTLDYVEFIPYKNQFIGFSTVPHGFLNNDIVTITSLYDYKKTGSIKISENSLILLTGIGSAQYTGIVTYFNVSGNLNYPNIRENDIYVLGSEKVKVIAIEPDSSRIKVIRNQSGTIGLSSFSAGTILTEQTRKLEVNFGVSTSYNYQLNKQIYFNPSESVGIGTSFGVGITSTLSFSNPGVGLTQITIPTKTIYLPNHNLNTGDELIYSSNTGSSISISTNGSSSFTLQQNSIVYAAKISENLIGISTIKVGLGSTGSFVGLGTILSSTVYFTGNGTGTTHSFTTKYSNTLTGQVSKNVATVITDSEHSLELYDKIDLNIKSGISTEIKITYNKNHRRLIVNYKNFSSANINLIDNTITINNHNLINGQKIIHTSISPAGGLDDNGIYYVITISPNKIKLATSFYNATKLNPEEVNITSSSYGTISPVNPPLRIVRNSEVKFNLSDASLSFTKEGKIYPAFQLVIYKDSNFRNRFEFSGKSSVFEIQRIGIVGKDSTASLTIKTSDNIPDNLFYNLEPINLEINTIENKEIIIDYDIVNNNKISFEKSSYSGNQTIVGISSTTFSFNLLETPEIEQYNSNSNTIEYFTNSITASGAINSVKILSGGKNYSSLPIISSIESENGYGAVLKPQSTNIGKVLKTNILDIGFNYSADLTIRPTAKLPTLLEVDNLSNIDSIDVISIGKNYTISPDLVLIDSYTNNVVKDIELDFDIKNRKVNIIKNTSGISEYNLEIIPINNSNGVGINSVGFNTTTKDVTIILDASFSEEEQFPFDIGDKVFVENISVGINSTAKGYNSLNYNYSTFTLTSVDKNIGGYGGSIVYNLSNYLEENEVPGKFDSFNSSGKVVPEKYFPVFSIKTRKNEFYNGENIVSNNSQGKIQSLDLENNIIKISSIDEFSVGDIIKGTSSNNTARIKSITNFDSVYDIDSSSIVNKGWEKETGFLSNNVQRMHDNDYYQYFSYALKSTIDYEKWNPFVSNLNHTSGFKKFSDLIVESKPHYSGISTEQNQSDFVGISDLHEVIDLNCYNDFDLVKENNITIENSIKSNQLLFNSRILQDYIESIGNRVLLIDDISPDFNSNPRSDVFSIVDTFLLNERYKKYFIFIQDKIFKDYKQVQFISLLNNNSIGYLNQYGRVETIDDLGSFDFLISQSSGNLLFYPTKNAVNSYDVSYVTFNLNDTLSGIGTASLGDVVKIDSSNTYVDNSVSTTIIQIPSEYKAVKVLVEISANDASYYEFNELTIVHNGTDTSILEYGQFNTSSVLTLSDTGIGTYTAYLSGGNLVVDLVSTIGSGVSFTVNTANISLGNSITTGIGTFNFEEGLVKSNYQSILSSPTPSPQIVSTIPFDCQSSYYIALVEDSTNNQYQVSEIIVLKSDSETLITEYGVIATNQNLGSFDSNLIGDTANLLFTPIQNINVNVTIFELSIGRFDDQYSTDYIDLNNLNINSGVGEYSGTLLDIRKQFQLNYSNNPIFERKFDSVDPKIVSIKDNTIKVPYHFFNTGEEIKYSYTNSDISSENAIGIATTSIPGIGTTDKLPTTLYVVKDSDLKIRVSASSSQSLKIIPEILDITTLGIGTVHKLTATKQNEKCLILIDNVIQSPIVSSSTTTGLSASLNRIDSILNISSTNLLFGGDLIKIDDEIMRIRSVDYPIQNYILVDRALLGTKVSSHPLNSLVTKVNGNYNILNNTLNFTEAPFGKVPFTNSSSSPDEQDYKGLEVSSRFNGRVFLRSGITNSLNETYYYNRILDDISEDFTGSDQEFTLKNNGSNITGISTGNGIILINSIFQSPDKNYIIEENVGISSIVFSGNISSTTYDINNSDIPRGGIIVSIASTQGFGYQPLVSAGGTAIVSIAGTIQSISIGNSGSGYRVGIQTVVNVAVATSSFGVPTLEYIGIASIVNGNVTSVSITNPGSGYTSTNPPLVIFDDALSYSNLPLIYSSSSTSGVGTGAKINVIVGQGSSVIDYEIVNYGYGYKFDEILTVQVGGTSGIQTNISLPFKEFQITVDSVFNDKFTGWTVGNLKPLDSIENLFDGARKVFPILIDGQQTTIRAKKGSNIDVQSTLLVFINNILQVPGEGYIFNGGSIIEFTEALKPDDKCSILFYRGTDDIDTVNVDVLETVKIGDTLKVNSDDIFYQENDRLSENIVSTDSVKTNLYSDYGISNDSSLLRPVTWCRQTEDKIVNGNYVTKDRTYYEPLITPTTNLIKSIGINSTMIFVENVKTFFDNESENIDQDLRGVIEIISQDTLLPAYGKVIVSAAGTISSIEILDGGVGYTTSPTISISNPIGLGTIAQASATISVGGTVSSVSITNPGSGYTDINSPIVLFETPSPKYELISDVSYSGDFGIITGIKTTSVGVASTGLVFDFFIPKDSFLRDSKINSVGIATTGISGISTGYYFVVKNSNIGYGLTSLDSNKSIIGIGSTFIDNIYQATSVSIAQTSVPGIGITYVAKVTVSVSSYNGLVGLGFSEFYGEYSWGIISNFIRKNPTNFNVSSSSTDNTPVIRRLKSLEYVGYSTL
jgi:hypothetical protein